MKKHFKFIRLFARLVWRPNYHKGVDPFRLMGIKTAYDVAKTLTY